MGSDVKTGEKNGLDGLSGPTPAPWRLHRSERDEISIRSVVTQATVASLIFNVSDAAILASAPLMRDILKNLILFQEIARPDMGKYSGSFAYLIATTRQLLDFVDDDGNGAQKRDRHDEAENELIEALRESRKLHGLRHIFDRATSMDERSRAGREIERIEKLVDEAIANGGSAKSPAEPPAEIDAFDEAFSGGQ